MNNTKQHSKRILWFDALKCFAIFLVLWGHVIADCRNEYDYNDVYGNSIYTFIYMFHMPLFMILSGYFAKGAGSGISFKKTFVQRFKQVFFPSLLIGLSAMVYFAIVGNIDKIDYNIFQNLWFLKSLFFCGIIYFLCTLSRHSTALFVITLLLSQLFLEYSINRMYPCFLFGVFLHSRIDWFQRNYKAILISSGIMFIVMLLFFDSNLLDIPKRGAIVEYTSQGNLTIMGEYIYKIMYRHLIGLAGSIFFIMLFYSMKRFFEKRSVGKWIADMGQFTLGVYILEEYFIVWGLRNLLKIDSVNIYIYSLIVTPLISFIVLIITCYLSKWLSKYKLGKLFLQGR